MDGPLNMYLNQIFFTGSSLEKVVDSVANFKRGQTTSKAGNGRYELKPEFYSHYNVFHYRYSREAQSKSEEKQR